MMKKFRYSIILVLLSLMVPLIAVAGPSSYATGFSVANLDSSNPAAIVITYYNQDGTTNVSPVSDTIPAGGVNSYFPIHTTAGFDGSAVISSDREVAAIVNVLGDNGAFGGADYGGFSSGATTSYVPQVLRNFFGISTWFNVQNTGNEDAAVTVTYSGSPAPTCTETATIKPGAAKRFDQSTSSCLSDNFIGAATVTTGSATQEIVSAVVQYNDVSLLSYSGFTNSGTASVVVPFVSHRWFGSRTAIQIQNTGGVNTNVTVTYTPSSGFPGQTCSETKSVPAGGSTNFGDVALFQSATNPCGPMTGTVQANYGFVGSAEVTGNSANQNLVAIVNTVTSGTPNGATYNAFSPDAGTNTVAFPQIMDRYFGIFTGFSVANVGTSPTSISCTFSNSSVTASQNNVAPGSAFTHVQLNQIGNAYLGAATCTATGGDAQIVGIVSQLGGQGDKLLYYEGFNTGN